MSATIALWTRTLIIATGEAARLYFREGEVWWVRLGRNIRYEVNGKSREFTCPVIILKQYNQYSFLALPLTTAPKPSPYRLPTGVIDGKHAFATLSHLRNRQPLDRAGDRAGKGASRRDEPDEPYRVHSHDTKRMAPRFSLHGISTAWPISMPSASYQRPKSPRQVDC